MKKSISKKLARIYVVTSILVMTNLPVLATEAEINNAWLKTKKSLNIWAFAMIMIGVLGSATILITAGDDEQKQTSAKKWIVGIVVGVFLIGLAPTIAYSILF
jgi:uncharacterized membrane protein